MDKFNSLLEIANILLGPDGCNWDKKQTFDSLKNYFIEEVYELVDAIDEKNNCHILDELGDVLYLIVFLSKLAEINNKFNISQVIENLSDKLRRRHPHIFGDEKVQNIQDIIDNWEKIKRTEKISSKRKNLFDRVPKSMPFLLKAQKIIKILKQKQLIQNEEKFISPSELEDQIFSLIVKAVNSGLEIEKAFKNKLKILLSQKNIKNTGDFLEA